MKHCIHGLSVDPNSSNDLCLVCISPTASEPSEIDHLRAEVEALRKCCTQRGARMQIMREWMREFPAYSQRYTTAWDEFAARNDALPWFDADGVPVEDAALSGEE